MTDAVVKRRYQEAYPCFHIVRAVAANAGGATVCQFVDNLRRTVGHLSIRERCRTTITLEYELASSYIRNCYESVTLDVDRTPNQVDANRRSVFCPGCKKRGSTLVFVGEWKCRLCHGLCYRSQLVDKHTLVLERRNTLKSLIKAGRPKGMHRTTFDYLKQELSTLSLATKGIINRGSSDAHAYVVIGTWTSPIEEPSLFSMNLRSQRP